MVGLATPPLFLEYEDVLKRAEHRLIHGLTLDEIDELLAELAAVLEPVETRFRWRPQVRDPVDEWSSRQPLMAGQTSSSF